MHLDDKVLLVDDTRLARLSEAFKDLEKAMKYAFAYGSPPLAITATTISTGKVVSYDKYILDEYVTNFEAPEQVETAPEDYRSKDNLRPSSDWNYLQLRKRKW